MGCHNISIVVIENGVCAHFLSSLHNSQSHSLGSLWGNVNFLTVPKELLGSHLDWESLSTLRSRIFCELVDAGHKFGLEEIKRVTCTDANLICLGYISMLSASTSIHLLINAEVCDLLLLVIRLNQTQVVLLEDSELVFTEEGEVVKASQILDQVDFSTLPTFGLVVCDVDLILYLLTIARVFHQGANETLFLVKT